MQQDMEESIRYFTDMIDEELQPVISEAPLPPLEFRPAEEEICNYYGTAAAQALVDLFCRYAMARAFIGDIIWVNEDYLAGRTEPLDDYRIAKIMMHEAVHARMTARDEISKVTDASLANALLSHPVVKCLNEGLCDYLPLSIIGTGENKCSDEWTVNYNTYVMARTALEESHLEGKPKKKLEREVRLYESQNINNLSRPYYFGAVFMHLISRHLGQEEAIKLVQNPFKEGIPDSFNKGDDSFLKCTMDDILSPHKYLLGRL